MSAGVLPLILVLVRLAVWAYQANQQPSEDQGRQVPGDGAMTAWMIAVFLGAFVLVGVLAPVLGPFALLALGVAPLALEPSWIARSTRSPWLAWVATRFSFYVWRKDRVGGAALMSTRAALASGSVPEPPEPTRITSGMVCALALHDAASGRVADARVLFEVARWFDAQPAPMQAIRNDWLAADAAARGRWDVVALAPETSAWTRFLRAVALRLLDVTEAPDPLELRALAQKAGIPDDDPILQRALHARHRPTFESPPLPDDPVDAAFEAHRRALVDPDGWRDLAVEAWDLAAELGEVPPSVLDAAAAELAGGSPTDGPFGWRLASQGEQARFDEVRSQAEALRERVARKNDLDRVSELREFAWFVAHLPSPMEPVPEGRLLERRALFGACHNPLVDWSADLYNRRGEWYLFRAITTYALAHAKAVGDARLVSLLQQNLKVSKPFA